MLLASLTPEKNKGKRRDPKRSLHQPPSAPGSAAMPGAVCYAAVADQCLRCPVSSPYVCFTAPHRVCPLPARTPDRTSGAGTERGCCSARGLGARPLVERGQPRPGRSRDGAAPRLCTWLAGVACPHWVSGSVSRSPIRPGRTGPRSNEQDPAFCGARRGEGLQPLLILVFGPDSPSGAGLTVRWASGRGGRLHRLLGSRDPRPGAHRWRLPGSLGSSWALWQAGVCLALGLCIPSLAQGARAAPPVPRGWLGTVILRSARAVHAAEEYFIAEVVRAMLGRGRRL